MMTLGNQVVSALWDTGSDLSLIGSDKVKEEIELTPEMANETPQAVEGSQVYCRSKMTLNVQIGNTIVKQHTFYVVPGFVAASSPARV